MFVNKSGILFFLVLMLIASSIVDARPLEKEGMGFQRVFLIADRF